MSSDIQRIKQRFGIIGNSQGLNRAIDIGLQVAPTDLSVLITGESGTGKEVFPQIIHSYSARKHGSYIAVNCGAIPEGTIDSELFGHEKGSFTGAMETRQGYFEVADGGTIFLDEVAELPLSTQVRLLRVLETGEFLRVGSSKVKKTDVRVIAATNINLVEAIQNGKFREDLYYRLNTVPINMPPLRERIEDIPLLFRKFASDFAEKYRMPTVTLDDDARRVLVNYKWPGNVRQLKNVTEQISVIEESRLVTADKLLHYLPDYNPTKLPALITKSSAAEPSFANEREILYKILFDMRNDVNDLKKLVLDMLQNGGRSVDVSRESAGIIKNLYKEDIPIVSPSGQNDYEPKAFPHEHPHIQDTEEILEESLSLADKEVEMIKKALEKYNGKRRQAAHELGISERTLYRKIKEYNLD
ncbi:MAG: sigma-54 dependent transcriptional regulator [Bacteroidales bacterium]|jgi:transcriptional regulator with PAS, ATPase and Fis domain|nr:sigma-54 dependent transcriptional regulator [Bacteroidales bacterium]